MKRELSRTWTRLTGWTMEVSSDVLQVKLSNGKTTAAGASGFVGILKERPRLLMSHVRETALNTNAPCDYEIR